MDNELLGVIVILMIVFITIAVLNYLLNAIVLGLWLKKSNIKNWGLAFVPFASNYKQIHYLYDVYHTKDEPKNVKSELINDNLLLNNVKEYVNNRRSFAVKVLFIIIGISFVVGIITGLLDEFTSIGTVLGNDTYGVTLSSIVSSLLSLIIYYILTYSMYRTVEVKTDNMFTLNSRTKSILLTGLAIVTLGVSYYVSFIYYTMSKKHRYYLANTLNEREIN